MAFQFLLLPTILSNGSVHLFFAFNLLYLTTKIPLTNSQKHNFLFLLLADIQMDVWKDIQTDETTVIVLQFKICDKMFFFYCNIRFSGNLLDIRYSVSGQ